MMIIVDSSMPRFSRSFRRRRTMAAPIVSYKHQASENITYAGLNANNNVFLFSGIAPGAEISPTTVAAGNKVYGVNVSVNFTTNTGTEGSTYSWMLVYFRQGQNLSSNFPGSESSNWSTIGLNNTRNQVIKSFMGVVGTEDGGLLRQNIRIKLPKMYQRIREGDTLNLVFNAAEAGTLSTGFRYKSFS